MNSEIGQTLARLEESLWRTETRGNKQLMDLTFAGDFFEIGRSGRIWRRDEMFGIYSSLDAVLPLSDLRITMLDESTALMTYTSIVKRGAATEYARRSSIWSLQGNCWKLRFHQGTPFVPNARQEQ